LNSNKRGSSAKGMIDMNALGIITSTNFRTLLALTAICGCVTACNADSDNGSGGGDSSATGDGNSDSTGDSGNTGAGDSGTTGAGDSESTGGGDSGSTGAGDSDSTGAGDSDSTGAGDSSSSGGFDEFACNGYFDGACSVCLQIECKDELIACAAVEDCCCVASCLYTNPDGADWCFVECGLQGNPQESDDLLACQAADCKGGQACP
jgi:hypothetical protein